MNSINDPIRAALRENETIVLAATASTHVSFFAGLHTRPERLRAVFTSARLLLQHDDELVSQIAWGDVEAHDVRKDGKVVLDYRGGTRETFVFSPNTKDEIARILPLLRAGGESTARGGRAWLCVQCHAPLERNPTTCVSCGRRYVTAADLRKKVLIPGGALMVARAKTAGVTVAILEGVTLFAAWNASKNAMTLGVDNPNLLLLLGVVAVLAEQIIATIAARGLIARRPRAHAIREMRPQPVRAPEPPKLPIRTAAQPPRPAAAPRPAPASAALATPQPQAPPPPPPARVIRDVTPEDHVASGTIFWTGIGVIVVALLIIAFTLGTWGIGIIVALIGMWLTDRKVTGILLGGAVRVGPYQFPEIHQRVNQLATAMGMHKAPDVYVLESNTQNAFAMKHGKKKSIVLIDDIVFGSTLTGNDNVLTWILAHELAHIALGHTDFFRGVMRGIVPPLSRLDEFTCDRVATAAVKDPDAVRDALTLLLVGPQLFARVNHRALMQQANELMKTKKGARDSAEARQTHPLLLHRYARLVDMLPQPRVTRTTSPGATLTT